MMIGNTYKSHSRVVLGKKDEQHTNPGWLVIPRQVLKLPEILGDSQREDLVLDFTGRIHTLHSYTVLRMDLSIPMDVAFQDYFESLHNQLSRPSAYACCHDVT